MSARDEVRLTPVRQDLKAASKALIRAYGGQEAAAEQLGRVQSRYSDAGSPYTNCFLTVDEVGELEDRTAGMPGHPLVTSALAKRQGYALVELPQALPVGPDLMPFIAEMGREFGQATAVACETLADGKVEPRELAQVEQEFGELIQIAVTIRAAMRALAGGQ